MLNSYYIEHLEQTKNHQFTSGNNAFFKNWCCLPDWGRLNSNRFPRSSLEHGNPNRNTITRECQTYKSACNTLKTGVKGKKNGVIFSLEHVIFHVSLNFELKKEKLNSLQYCQMPIRKTRYLYPLSRSNKDVVYQFTFVFVNGNFYFGVHGIWTNVFTMWPHTV